ncbi:MAG: peptidoglycan DD-metalloendopeptidase family protein [Clostridiales bacterium]|nr:peptidoglycan DD-metalloendopeptidase family protein [Clostridiales bacterium]
MRRIRIGLIFLLIFTITFTGIVSANDEIKRRERELEELRLQMEELDASIDNNQSLQSETNQKIRNVTAEVKTLEKEITNLDGEIKATESAIIVKTEELAAAEIKIGEKNELLNQRLRVMYKTGSVGYLEVLFGAEDFTDLLSRIDMLQKILVHDQNLIQSLKEQRDIIEQKKVELETIKDDLLALFKSKIAKQNELNVALNNLVAYKKELINDEVALVEMEDALLDEANKLTEIIKNLELAATYVGGEMMWPVPGQYKITSPFGNRLHPISKQYKMHTGIDISGPKGTPVVAAQTGTVVYANWFGSYGKAIIVDHGGGITTLYAHNDTINVSVGSVVKKGDNIALLGSTGYSTGPHLHFEVRINGEYVEPLTYVKGN